MPSAATSGLESSSGAARRRNPIVESLNPASGAAFSLLPPENASGNWVKVTQRVPVRILLVDASPKYPLRVQTSTVVSIDTGAGQTPAGRSRGVTLTDAEALSAAASRGLEVADANY